MHRLVSFPVLYALAIGCFVAAIKVKTVGCSPSLPSTTLLFIVAGFALAFAAVALPWCRYVRADHDRVRASEYVLGFVGGVVAAAIPGGIVTVFVLGSSVLCD